MLTPAEIQALDADTLDRMPSDAYKANHDPSNPNSALFRAKAEELADVPVRRGASSTPVVAPAPAPTGFDPSFDESPEAAIAAAKARLAPAPKAADPAAPATEQPAAAETSATEIVREYQPVDSNGRPIGGKQRFVGKTTEEVLDKVIAAHKAASARIRILSRDRKLEEIADAGVKSTSVPRPTDAVPATPEELAAELRAVRQSNYALAIQVAVNTWLERCPEYATRYKSQTNNESIILAVGRAGDDETSPDSYMRAWETMKDVLEPVVALPAAAAPVVETKAAAAVAPIRADAVGISTGLSNADQTSVDAPVAVAAAANQGWTAQKIEALPTEQYKRIVRDPRIAQVFDRVLNEHEARKAEARRNKR